MKMTTSNEPNLEAGRILVKSMTKLERIRDEGIEPLIFCHRGFASASIAAKVLADELRSEEHTSELQSH